MACAQISAITQNCVVSTGGISKLYLANFDNVASYAQNSIGTITGITMANSTKFQEFTFLKDSAMIEEDFTPNQENGTSYHAQKISLHIGRRDAAKRNAISLLGNGLPRLACLAKDVNGLVWFLGLTQGVWLSSNKASSGGKRGDLNGYQMEFSGEEQNAAPEVDATILSTLI